MHAVFGKGLLQRRDDAADQRLPLLAQEGQPGDDGFPRIGMELPERQILELVLPGVDADALRQRGIDFQRFQRDTPALVLAFDKMQRAHIVQPVGQLHQQDADILRHRQHQLAEILRLLGLVGLQLDAGQLGHAIDEARDLLAEQLLDIRQRRVGILDGVMQQGGDDGIAVQLQVGQDTGNFDGVGEIGIARGALLRAVHLHGIDIGAVELRLIRTRIVGANTLDQFVLTHHGAPSSQLMKKHFIKYIGFSALSAMSMPAGGRLRPDQRSPLSMSSSISSNLAPASSASPSESSSSAATRG